MINLLNYEHRIDKQKYFNIHLTSVYKYFNKYIFKENYSSIINYYSKQRMLFYFIFYVYYNEKILLFFRDSRFTILRFFLFFPRFTHFLANISFIFERYFFAAVWIHFQNHLMKRFLEFDYFLFKVVFHFKL